ncbi:MAG: KUP/HAK/KT family potassium transporter [Trebonia sp.]
MPISLGGVVLGCTGAEAMYADRFAAEPAGSGLLKLAHLTVRVGYRDPWNVPRALAPARTEGFLERNLDLEHAPTSLRMRIVPSDASGMAGWRKRLFVALARNAASPVEHFGLAGERPVVTSSDVPV